VLVVPYLVGIAYVIGFGTAGVLYAAFGLVAFVLVAVRRRRSRNAAGQ
jgi:MYXO-CTERM domain-containing protein